MNESMRRLVEEHRQELETWLTRPASEADALDETAWQAELRRNTLAAARAYDPAVHVPEELTLRLVGSTAERGALDLELTPVLDGVRRSFVEGQGVTMALVGVGEGSTVLFFRPTEDQVPEPVAGDPDVPVDATRADAAGRSFVAMVAAAEAGDDVRRWTSMLRGLEDAAKALDAQDLVAHVCWASMGGALVSAKLSSAGRGNLRALAEPRSIGHPKHVSGRVTELRETGRVKLKTGLSKTSPVHEVLVPSATLLAMRLELGMQAHFVVNELRQVDSLDREVARTLEFVRVALPGEAFSEAETLDIWDPEEPHSTE